MVFVVFVKDFFVSQPGSQSMRFSVTERITYSVSLSVTKLHQLITP